MFIGWATFSSSVIIPLPDPSRHATLTHSLTYRHIRHYSCTHLPSLVPSLETHHGVERPRMCLLVCARASWRVRVVAEHLGVLGLDQGAASGFAALLRGFLRGLSMTLWAMTLAHSSSVILNASRHTRPWRGAAGALAKMAPPSLLPLV